MKFNNAELVGITEESMIDIIQTVFPKESMEQYPNTCHGIEENELEGWVINKRGVCMLLKWARSNQPESEEHDLFERTLIDMTLFSINKIVVTKSKSN